MSERAPYSRVYWSVRSDPRLVDIYPDDHHWATWNRLLLAADMAWPAPADLPRNVRKASLAALIAAGVVELLPGGLFRFHGLEAERNRRREAATRVATGTQAGPKRDPVAFRTTGLRRDETSKDETRRDDARDDGRKDLEAWLVVKYRPPTERQRAFLDVYCRTFDQTGPERAAQLIYAHPDDPIAALKADRDAFIGQRAEAARKAEKPVRPEPRRASGLTGINAELARWLYPEKEDRKDVA